MPLAVVAQRIDWTWSVAVLKDRARELRPVYRAWGPASRSAYLAGERVQRGLRFPPVDVPLGHGQVCGPPLLVMAAGYPRMVFALMVPSRRAAGLIAGVPAVLSG